MYNKKYFKSSWTELIKRTLVAIPAGHLENSQRSLGSPPRRWQSTRPPQPQRSAFQCLDNVLLQASLAKFNSLLEIVLWPIFELEKVSLISHSISRQNHIHKVHTSKQSHHETSWNWEPFFSLLWLTDDAEKRKHYREPILASISK